MSLQDLGPSERGSVTSRYRRLTTLLRKFPLIFELISLVRRRSLFWWGIRGLGIDIYHEPNYISLPFSGATIISVHDLSVRKYPDYHPNSRVHYINSRLQKSIESADFVLTGTEAIRKEILESYAICPSRVVVTPYGGRYQGAGNSGDEIQVLEKAGLKNDEYVLMVGALEPRKNISRLAKAFMQLDETILQDTKLVLVGPSGWGGVEFESSERIVVLGDVDEQLLTVLYKNCLLFAYPSLYEGFGLPIVEAMESGAAVLTSETGATREVAGDAAIFVDPESTESIRTALSIVITDSSFRRKLRERSKVRAQAFSWLNCAQETKRVYEQALNEKR